MTYTTTPTAQPVITYAKSDLDVIAAVTQALRENIETRNYHRAEIDFRTLMATIRSKGFHGKDIRYVERELGELARAARLEGHDDVARVASKYLNQLPKPADNGKERRVNGLERMIA